VQVKYSLHVKGIMYMYH